MMIFELILTYLIIGSPFRFLNPEAGRMFILIGIGTIWAGIRPIWALLKRDRKQ